MSDFQQYLDEALKAVDIRDLPTDDGKPAYDIFEEISELIVSTRNDLGITQKELSDLTGLTQANISKIECGATRPTIDTLRRIADGLGKRLSVRFADIAGDE